MCILPVHVRTHVLKMTSDQTEGDGLLSEKKLFTCTKFVYICFKFLSFENSAELLKIKQENILLKILAIGRFFSLAEMDYYIFAQMVYKF